MPEQFAPESPSERLGFRWHRSADGESWELIEGAEAETGRLLLTAEEVGGFVFVEWSVTSEGGAGDVLREGASEMSASAVRLPSPTLPLPLPLPLTLCLRYISRVSPSPGAAACGGPRRPQDRAATGGALAAA